MSTYRRLLRYVVPYWKRMVLLLAVIAVFASLSSVSLTLIPPFIRILLDESPAPALETAGAPGARGEGIPLPAAVERIKERAQHRFESYMYAGSARDRLWRFCRVIVLLMLVKNIFGYLQTYMTEYLEQKVLYRIRRDVYAHVLDLPLSYFDRERSGHLISKITNDVTMLRGSVIGVTASVIRNVLMTLIAVVIILLVSWKLTLIALLVVPVNVVLVGAIGRRLRRRSHRAQERMADMTANLEEAITGVRVVKAFVRGAYERLRFEGFNHRYAVQNIRMNLWAALTSPTSELLGALSFVVILWYGGLLVVEGAVPPENLVMFVGAMLFVITPVKALSRLNNLIQQSLAAAQRVFALLDVPGEPLDAPGRQAAFTREIRFDAVSFAYVSGEPVLRDVSFGVAPGEVVAIVGPSGAGKSTLVDLIPRFYTPTAGRVLLDGVDTREIQLGSLRGLMGIVTQETILFNDTVRRNIAYGSEACPQEDVEHAARVANAHEFIVRMPHGYDTVIGDRGVQLSGGQRQRLAIARALLRDPQILIFDEATSALDTESERLVQEAIDRLLQGRTTFVI
ncbi:MAG: ABC transporter ATP-binding protein/permease, partial [Candidatus Krumholzibacteria bacterium]|nr:ABC transporter ATP-binding protein/permease [Candidatus Krumholzibacteria bacterium]